MLLHAGVKRDIIILDPSTEGVEEQDWFLVAELEELVPGVVEEEHVAIVEGVPQLEGVDGVCILCLDLLVDLLGGLSVLVESVVELDLLNETHRAA